MNDWWLKIHVPEKSYKKSNMNLHDTCTCIKFTCDFVL